MNKNQIQKVVKFKLSNFKEEELVSHNKILIIDDQVSNCETIDGLLMILQLKDRMQTTVYAQDGFQAWK